MVTKRWYACKELYDTEKVYVEDLGYWCISWLICRRIVTLFIEPMKDRQILSGIAKFYPNEQELVGKKLQIVANLKPRKMMKKYVSQGMILSAEHGDQLTVLTVDPSVPNGSIIG